MGSVQKTRNYGINCVILSFYLLIFLSPVAHYKKNILQTLNHCKNINLLKKSELNKIQ